MQRFQSSFKYYLQTTTDSVNVELFKRNFDITSLPNYPSSYRLVYSICVKEDTSAFQKYILKNTWLDYFKAKLMGELEAENIVDIDSSPSEKIENEYDFPIR